MTALIFHGTNDRTIRIHHADEIARRAGTSVEYVRYEHGDHCDIFGDRLGTTFARLHSFIEALKVKSQSQAWQPGSVNACGKVTNLARH
jgi:pimeloyl-ACP methyl ester carboxylesterase